MKFESKNWDLQCERCGHEWTTRGDKLPKTCVKCKSPYWDRPRLVLREGVVRQLPVIVAEDGIDDKNVTETGEKETLWDGADDKIELENSDE